MMGRMINRLSARLRACAGETLVETLVAILISVLAVVVLSTGIAVAAKFNADAHQRESDIRASLRAAQEASTGTEVASDSVKISSDSGKTHTYDVDVYGGMGGDSSGVVSYAMKEG